MNEIVKANASKYGLILAGISVGFALLAYLIDITLMVNMGLGISMWVLGLVVLVAAVIASKKGMGGFISFKDAFSTFIIGYIISALIGTTFLIVLFNVVDTGAADQLQEITIEKTIDMMEQFNVPEDQMLKQIEELEATSQFDIVNQVKGFFMAVVGYALIGLIVAAIVKKEKPLIYQDNEDAN